MEGLFIGIFVYVVVFFILKLLDGGKDNYSGYPYRTPSPQPPSPSKPILNNDDIVKTKKGAEKTYESYFDDIH